MMRYIGPIIKLIDVPEHAQHEDVLKEAKALGPNICRTTENAPKGPMRYLGRDYSLAISKVGDTERVQTPRVVPAGLEPATSGM